MALSQKQIHKIVKLRTEGKSLGYIGEIFGVSRQRIYQILTNAGVPKSGRFRLPVGQASGNAILRHYKCGAKERKLTWSLTDSQFYNLCKMNCRYCDLPPSNMHRAGGGRCTPFVYSGIDRLNNLKGYALNNVAPCCKMCNFAKRDTPIIDWIKWLKRIKEKA